MDNDPIEVAIHSEIRAMLQAISDRHGIQVNAVQVAWINTSSVVRRQYHAADINISSTTGE